MKGAVHERAERVLREYYGLKLNAFFPFAFGAGSLTGVADTDEGFFVLKYPSTSEINNPRLEPELCDYLLARGLPVSEFRRSLSGDAVCEDDEGVFHLQRFIEGRTLEWHTAPPWLMQESAAMLGKIHTALEGYSLPEGIGKGFFEYMTPERAATSYRHTLRLAEMRGDESVAQGVRYRLGLLERMEPMRFDLDRLTCRSTHGDYCISQLICGEERINAVIDWTTACVHPAVWEIIRSFAYADPDSRDGTLDAERLCAYTAEYLRYAQLNEYDLWQMPRLFMYQLAVCDYYGQYYGSEAANRRIFLGQAELSTRMLAYLERECGRLSQALAALAR